MPNNKIKLTVHGAGRTVTGSNHLLEIGRKKILLDCGMYQGFMFGEETNYSDFPYDPAKIDYVLVSHAHIDHTGRIPKLYKDGFRGRVYTVKPTIDIARHTLEDSARIIGRESRDLGITPFMDLEDVSDVMSLFTGVEFFEEISLDKDIKVKFMPAGHILGSAIIEIKAYGKTIVFTGDLGNSPSPLIQATYFPEQADYVIMESTYGDRNHIAVKERKDLLRQVICDTLKRRGVLMIPSFAVERTQELLYDLNNLFEQGELPRTPVFIDSPLAIKVTDVYNKYQHYFSKQAQKDLLIDDEILNFPGLKFTFSREESKDINGVKAPKIIIAGNGMSEGGRILYHEERYLGSPKNTLLMVGFQVQGSLGRRLIDGHPEVRILNKNIKVKAEIVSIRSYSAHADQDGLVDFVAGVKTKNKKVVLVHGEYEAQQVLAERIKNDLKMEAVIPELHDTIIIN